MKKIFILNLFFLFSFTSFDLAQAKIKLYLNNDLDKFIMVEKQDCSIHKTKDNYVKFGFRFGNVLFNFCPDVTFGKKVGIDWNRSVHAFISRFQALCTRFNSGSMTKEEYDRETEKLGDIEERMAKLEKEALEAIDKDADDMFQSLDKELTQLDKRRVELDEEKRRKIKSELRKILKELEEE